MPRSCRFRRLLCLRQLPDRSTRTRPSLFQSIETAGEQPDLAIAMAQIFGGEIDFNTELQPGDRYTVAFDRLEREGRRSSYGAITAAEFQNDGRVVRAIRFTPKGGQPGYYDLEGRSAAAFLSAISAQVRTASDVRLFVATHAPGAPYRLGRIVVLTTARQ